MENLESTYQPQHISYRLHGFYTKAFVEVGTSRISQQFLYERAKRRPVVVSLEFRFTQRGQTIFLIPRRCSGRGAVSAARRTAGPTMRFYGAGALSDGQRLPRAIDPVERPQIALDAPLDAPLATELTRHDPSVCWAFNAAFTRSPLVCWSQVAAIRRGAGAGRGRGAILKTGPIGI